jgi:sulfur transfer protein SufE/stress-induced morphogen
MLAQALLLVSILVSYAYFPMPFYQHVRVQAGWKMSIANSAVEYCLTPTLKTYADGLRAVTDEKLRYQQLLFMAAKASSMDNALKIDANKVPGCLSTVHVHAHMDEKGKVHYVGDSDSQLTKGLVVLLVNGLSGSSAEDILKVKPEFIQYAGVAKSLTPGRNNGFLNMLKLMKAKAKQLADDRTGSTETVEQSVKTSRPIYNSLKTKLSMLKPSELVIEDQSHRHTGHSGVSATTGSETHFAVKIVANCFQGLSLVQRHKMIYTLLSQEMAQDVHALSIVAKTTDEI